MMDHLEKIDDLKILFEKKFGVIDKVFDEEFIIDFIEKINKNLDPNLIEFIADASKTFTYRNFFTKIYVFQTFFNLLNLNNFDILKQTCRAIGNICFENDIACEIVDSENGIQIITTLLNKLINKEFDFNTEDNEVLKSICLGCLLNVINSKEDYQLKAINNKIISILNLVIRQQNKSLGKENILYNCILILFCIIELENGKELFKKTTIVNDLIDIFKNLDLKNNFSNQVDTIEALISFLNQLSHSSNDLKNDLSVESIMLKLLSILDHKQIDNELLTKSASNLLIEIISDEEISKKYYNKGKSEFFNIILKWIDNYLENYYLENEKIEKNSEKIEKNLEKIEKNLEKNELFITKQNNQLSTAILIVGNFSSCNEDSENIASIGMIKKLIKIFEINQDFTIQYSCLSTLRNLAISPENKIKFLREGHLNKLLLVDFVESPSIVFKYAATLRILTDNQPIAAAQIATNTKFLNRLRNWSSFDDLQNIKSEVSRLYATLLKNISIPTIMKKLVEESYLKLLVFLLKSNYLKMQNEGLIGIGILVTKLDYNILINNLIKNNLEFLNLVKILIKNNLQAYENSDSFEVKFIENLVSILNLCLQKYELHKLFDEEILDLLKILKENFESVNDTIDNILNASK